MSAWLTWLEIWLKALGPAGFIVFLLGVVTLGGVAMYGLSRTIEVPDEAPIFDPMDSPPPPQRTVVHETLKQNPSATTFDFLHQVEQEQVRLRTLLTPQWLAFPFGRSGRCPVCGALVHDDDVLLHTEWHVRGVH